MVGQRLGRTQLRIRDACVKYPCGHDGQQVVALLPVRRVEGKQVLQLGGTFELIRKCFEESLRCRVVRGLKGTLSLKAGGIGDVL